MLSIGLASLLIAAAVLSPCPPLVDTLSGSVLSIFINISFTFIITIVKIGVASHLRETTSDRFSDIDGSRFYIFQQSPPMVWSSDTTGIVSRCTNSWDSQ